MDYLELSVPIGGSGKFIEMHHTGVLQKARPLWAKYSRLRMRLENVKEKLSNCNDAVWLFRFADTCRRQGQDFEKQLRLYVDGLENQKKIQEKEDEEICSQMKEVDPSLSEVCHTLAGSRLLHHYEVPYTVSQTFNDDIVKRRGIIAKYPHLGSSNLCGRFHLEGLSVPEEWRKQFPEVNSWVTAYKNPKLRNRIHKMISEEKRRLRLQ